MILVARYVNRGFDVVEPLIARATATASRRGLALARQYVKSLTDALMLSGLAVIVSILLIQEQFITLGWSALFFAGGVTVGYAARHLGRYRDVTVGLALSGYVTGRLAYAGMNGDIHPAIYLLAFVAIMYAATYIVTGVQAIRMR